MLSLIIKHRRLIIIWGLIGLVVGAGVSLAMPRAYSAESHLLIITRDRQGADPYTQAKAAERIGENLAAVVATDDFSQKVMENPAADFNKDRWTSLDDRSRRRRWQRDVKAEMVYGTNLLKLVAFSNTSADTTRLSQAITQTLANRGSEYVSGEISFKIVDSSLVSRWPTRPNLTVNLAFGALLGCLVGAWWVVRYKKHGLFGQG